MNSLGNNLVGTYGDSLIYLEDGIKVKIKEVVRKKLKSKVLTFNEKLGSFEYKRIINWSTEGIAKHNNELLHIQTEGLGQKNGEKNGVITTILTPFQKVLTKRGWVEACYLSLEDFLVSSYLGLQGEMWDFLYAITVGDSFLHANSTNSKNTASLVLNDSNNPEYVQWKIGKLSNVFTFHKSTLGFVSEYTHDLKLLKDEISLIPTASLRNPLPFLERHFSLLGLAIWIMDDAHFSKFGSYILSMGRLAKYKGVLGQVSYWFKKRGYENSMTKDGGLRFNKKASNKIASEIYRFIPESMQYKLPEEFRNKYEEFDIDYELKLMPEYVKVKSIRNVSNRQMNKLRSVYNLELKGTDNYVTGMHSNGVIVKGTNSYQMIST